VSIARYVCLDDPHQHSGEEETAEGEEEEEDMEVKGP
jgi:hypothetical protein